MTGQVNEAVLQIRDLEVAYEIRTKKHAVLRGIDLQINAGEVYGLVGESGCGKTTAAFSAVGYLPKNASASATRLHVNGGSVLDMSAAQRRQFWAKNVSMVFQDPQSALNPAMAVGPQVREVFQIAGLGRTQAQSAALNALESVHIANPASVMRRYPHELSGGMLQRVVIAMALGQKPSLLVLDEPTTGLDATVEAEVLDLIRRLCAQTDAAVLLIAHNLGVIRTMCDRVGVMYAGQMVEEGPAATIFEQPTHPYTQGLLGSIPRRGLHKTHSPLTAISGNMLALGADLGTCGFLNRCEKSTDLCGSEAAPVLDACGVVDLHSANTKPDGLAAAASLGTAPIVAETKTLEHWVRCHHPQLMVSAPNDAGAQQTSPANERPVVLSARSLSKTFRQKSGDIPALISVDLEIRGGETLGLVGESGSGKTTLAKSLLGLHSPDEGAHLSLGTQNVAASSTQRSQEQLKALQIVFQNPDSALNPSWKVRAILKRAAKKLGGFAGRQLEERVEQVAAGMQLSTQHLEMKPKALSGGLKQRVAIARAFIGDPEIVVCDEPTSALDVSVQAAILNLLNELQDKTDVSYLFISHDIAVVRYLADRIAVMYLGRIVEIASTQRLFNGPVHPYTHMLLSSVPNVDGEISERVALEGSRPEKLGLAKGCSFFSFCTHAIEGLCDVQTPELTDIFASSADVLEAAHSVACHLSADQLPLSK